MNLLARFALYRKATHDHSPRDEVAKRAVRTQLPKSASWTAQARAMRRRRTHRATRRHHLSALHRCRSRTPRSCFRMDPTCAPWLRWPRRAAHAALRSPCALCARDRSGGWVSQEVSFERAGCPRTGCGALDVLLAVMRQDQQQTESPYAVARSCHICSPCFQV